MALANRALFGSRFEENNRPGIEMNVDGSMEVVLPDGSRFALDGSGASFPPEWTVGVDGALTIETGVANGTPLEIVIQDDQTAAGFRVVNEQGTVLFRAGGTQGVEMTSDPTGAVSRVSIGASSIIAEDEEGTVMVDIQGGYINLGNGGKIAAGPTDVYVGGPTDTVGFYGAAGVAQQTGVAVTAAAIHAALVSLGLITA